MNNPYNNPYVKAEIPRTTVAMAQARVPTTQAATIMTLISSRITLGTTLPTEPIRTKQVTSTITQVQPKIAAPAWELSAAPAAYLIVACDEMISYFYE